MSGTAAVYAPRAPRQQGTGEGAQWTEEQKAAYQKQWDNYTRLMAKRVQGQTRDFDAVVFRVEEPRDIPNNFPGAKKATRTVRKIGVQLAQPGVDMLRFYGDSADNPFNDKTLLNKLIIAAAGFTPKEEEGLSIDYSTLYGKRVRVTLEKQGPRSDGQRGGFWTGLKDIQPIFEDDDELPVQNESTRTRVVEAGGEHPIVERSVADDEEPWN